MSKEVVLDVVALPDLDVLRVQMWIYTSFYSLTYR